MFRAFNRDLSVSFNLLPPSFIELCNHISCLGASPLLSYSPSVSFLFSLPPSLLPPRRWSSSPYSCSPPCGRSSPPAVTSQQRGLRRGQYAAAAPRLRPRSCSAAGGGCAPAAPAAAAVVLQPPALAANSRPCAALLAGRLLRAPLFCSSSRTLFDYVYTAVEVFSLYRLSCTL